MIVGFDVHHGEAGSGAGSVGAMVATTSDNYCKYYSTVSFFNSREELLQKMVADIGSKSSEEFNFMMWNLNGNCCFRMLGSLQRDEQRGTS